MKLLNPETYLSGNRYPGRGILLGLHPDGKRAVAAYFIMGRSENSRNRVFVPGEDGGIRTRAFDESKMKDPSLIIYAPVRPAGEGTLVVTNGDQTDTVCEFLSRGQTFEEALRTRTLEPDGPNWTPRISGVLRTAGGRIAYALSILKSADGNGESVQRFFYEYPEPVPGEGRLIHTYEGDGAPIPSFEGEPRRVEIRGSLDEFTDGLWKALDADNKVSLYTCFMDPATGARESRIVNKNR